MIFKLYKFGLISFWIILFYLIYSSAIKDDVVFENKENKEIFRAFFPEAWGFFTKSPNDDLLDIYKINSDLTLEKITINNSSFKNYIGLSRKARIIGYQSSILLSAIYVDSLKWKDSAGSYNFFIPETMFSVVRNESLTYFPKGNYILIKYKPLPWAWFAENQNKFKPYQYIGVNIE